MQHSGIQLLFSWMLISSVTIFLMYKSICVFIVSRPPFFKPKTMIFLKACVKVNPHDWWYKTKQNRRNQGQETIVKEEVIGIFFFNIWWLLTEPFCWWFLNQCGPSRHLPRFSTISWGDHLVQALWFVVVPLAIFLDSPPLVEGKTLYKPCDFVLFFPLVY